MSKAKNEMTQQAIQGRGRFQWNAGGWFGSAIGSSAWMLVATGFLIAKEQPMLSAIPASGFVVVMATTVSLWVCRGKVYPFPALITLMGTLAVVFPAVWFLVQAYASPSTLEAMNWPKSQGTLFFVAVTIPLAMVWFILLERSGTTDVSSPNANSKPAA